MFSADAERPSARVRVPGNPERREVARYRHAQLSAVRLAGDISGKMDDVSLDELLVTVKQEWAKLAPLIDLEAVQVPEKD